MNRNDKIFMFIIAVIVFVGMAYVMYHEDSAQARLNGETATFTEHVGAGDCMDWDQQDLTGEATSSVTTRCAYVDACGGSVNATDTGASVPPTFVCNVPTQSGTNLGKVIMHVDVPGGNASGTTTVNYWIAGYGRR